MFILITNLLGYIPLPINTVDKINVAGLHLPSFQIYAADTNVALPLVLALGVFIAYNVEGLRHHGFVGYLKSLVPSGVAGGMLLPAAALVGDPTLGQPARWASPDRFHVG